MMPTEMTELLRAQGQCGAIGNSQACILPLGHAGAHGWEETKPAPRVDHERLCPDCHGMGRAVESASGGRLVTVPCVACHGAGYVDDREAWVDQEVVPGVRRAYLTALEDVAKAARSRDPRDRDALDAALSALDRAPAAESAGRAEGENKGSANA